MTQDVDQYLDALMSEGGGYVCGHYVPSDEHSRREWHGLSVLQIHSGKRESFSDA